MTVDLDCPHCGARAVEHVEDRDVDEGCLTVIDELECQACGWTYDLREAA